MAVLTSTASAQYPLLNWGVDGQCLQNVTDGIGGTAPRWGDCGAGWTSDGGSTSTPLRADIANTPADGGFAVIVGEHVVNGGLAAGILSYGPIEARGRPPGVPRGGNFGYAMLGTVDTTEGAVWVTQDGNPPTADNFALAGNGSSTEVNAGGTVFGAVCDHAGWQLLPLAVACSGTPRFQVNLSLGLLPHALSTCAAGIEGHLERDVLAGASTGKRTKLCLCTSDGAGAYAWQNVASGTLGSSTACGAE
jgi:hypothetical protein